MAYNQTQTTDASGLATFTDVQVGSGYTLAQSAATPLDGYTLFSNTAFTVTEGMSTFDVEIQPAAGNDLTLTATVVDDSATPQPVPGAVFRAYADIGLTMQLGSDLTSDASGQFEVPHLVGATSPGRTYYLSQVSAPTGYDPVVGSIPVAVVFQVTPTISDIVNPQNKTSVPIKVQDTNYSNFVFPSIDMTLSRS